MSDRVISENVLNLDPSDGEIVSRLIAVLTGIQVIVR